MNASEMNSEIINDFEKEYILNNLENKGKNIDSEEPSVSGTAESLFVTMEKQFREYTNKEFSEVIEAFYSSLSVRMESEEDAELLVKIIILSRVLEKFLDIDIDKYSLKCLNNLIFQ